MCCFVGILAFLGPRVALATLWIFGDRVELAFDSWWVPLLGLIFLPWTTLVYALVWQVGGLDNWEILLVVGAVALDVLTYMQRTAAKSVNTAYRRYG